MEFKEFLRIIEGMWFADDKTSKFHRQTKTKTEKAYEDSKGGTTKHITQPKPPQPSQG